MRSSGRRLLVVLLGVGVLSLVARLQLDLRLPMPERHDWVVSDADSLYQLRRVERVFAEGLPVADTDPDLAWPGGKPIQWPPGYPLLCWAVLAPFAPADAAARAPWLEHAMGLLPLLFGVATTLLAALGGWLLAGGCTKPVTATSGPDPPAPRATTPRTAATTPRTAATAPGTAATTPRIAKGGGPPAGAAVAGAPDAECASAALTGALVAGGVHALALPSISYTAWGNADYHGLAALLAGALPLLLALALRGDRLSSRARALRLGAGAGLVAGALWVTWLGAIHHVITLDAALGLLLCVERGERRAGLAAWGVGMNAAALALVLPCSLASPWLESQPWSAEFMGWLQPALLLLGALVLLPAALLAPASALARRWPALAAGGLALLAAALLLVDNPVLAGLRAGVASATGAGAFSEIAESRPLLGAGVGFQELLRTLGPVGLLLPLCWAAAALAALREPRARPLVPLLLSALVLLVLALLQRRFANELVLPMAVITGWAVARWRPAAVARAPAAVRVLLGLALVALLQAPTVALMVEVAAGTAAPRFPERRLRAQHHLHEWLAAHTPEPPDYSVLATWGHGNSLLWVARRPDVATQFGYYLGEESRLAPARFFLADDPAAGDARLAHHRSRYVLVNPPDQAAVLELASMLGPQQVERLVSQRSDGAVALRPAFASTLWGRLLGGSGLVRLPLPGVGLPVHDETAPPGTLRLVHVGDTDARGQPFGWIFERVPGAVLELRAPADGPAGVPLSVTVTVAYPGLAQPLVFTAQAAPGADGVARVRVPYATADANGEGRAAGPAIWTLGALRGTIAIGEDAVLQGRSVALAPGT